MIQSITVSKKRQTSSTQRAATSRAICVVQKAEQFAQSFIEIFTVGFYKALNLLAMQHQSNTAVVASQSNSFMMCDLIKPPVGIVPFFTEVIVKH